MEVVGKAFEKFQAPFKNASKFYADQGYPNVGLTVAFLGELTAFGLIGLAGKKGKAVISNRKLKADLKKLQNEPDITKIAEGLDKIKEDVKVVASGFEGKPDQIRRKMNVLNPERLALLKNQLEVQKTEIVNNPEMSPRAKSKKIKEIETKIL